MAYVKRAMGTGTGDGAGSSAFNDARFPSDPQTERFRQSLAAAQRNPTTRHLLSRALAYADESETRIVELTARIRQLEALAHTDELTGLLNRRGFDDVLRRNLLSAARYEEAGLFAYIDLNDFKSINDRYGHTAGDEVLRAVGSFLSRSIRATDYAARLGGDEFAILFVRADHKRARERAREMLRGIADLEISCKSHRISVTASLGLASYNGETCQADLIERADRAMYADKKSGGRAMRLTTHG
ncbi:GGDEF domain-containing protein [Parvibaculum lavamentivorans]|nr:GGDEF domain-containing protein [Parvibaculum lavamentivorans]